MNMLMIIGPTFVALLLPEIKFYSLGQIRLEEACDQSLEQICTFTNIGGIFKFQTIEKVLIFQFLHNTFQLIECKK